MPSIISASTTSTTALNFTADTSGVLALQTGATPTTAITIDTSQNVGIGTASPGFKLHIVGSGTGARARIESTSTANGQISFINTSTSSTGFVVGLLNDTSGDALIYHQDAKAIQFWTNSTERMRIDSSGNVGIGTSSPAIRLSVATSTSKSTASTINAATFASSDALGSADLSLTIRQGGSATQSARWTGIQSYENGYGVQNLVLQDLGGNVGIGTSVPFADTGYLSLDIRGSSTGSQINMGTTSTRVGQITCDTTNGITFNTATATPLRFFTNGGEAARITSGGDLLVGTTTGGTNQKSKFKTTTTNAWPLTLESDNRGLLVIQTNSSGGIVAYFVVNSVTEVGSIQTNSTSTSYVTSSDYRLKENISPMTGALDKVAQLKPVTYNWKVNGSAGQGFIAHELQEIIPDAVVGEKDGEKMQGVDTSFLVATLTAAIQELKAELDEAKAEIQALKGAQ